MVAILAPDDLVNPLVAGGRAGWPLGCQPCGRIVSGSNSGQLRFPLRVCDGSPRAAVSFRDVRL